MIFRQDFKILRVYSYAQYQFVKSHVFKDVNATNTYMYIPWMSDHDRAKTHTYFCRSVIWIAIRLNLIDTHVVCGYLLMTRTFSILPPLLTLESSRLLSCIRLSPSPLSRRPLFRTITESSPVIVAESSVFAFTSESSKLPSLWAPRA